MANIAFDTDSLNGELLSDIEQPSLPSLNESLSSDSEEASLLREEHSMDKRRSVSLMDVSKIEAFKTIPGKNLSWGTIGSGSSVGGRYSRDSGNQSWSLLSVASEKLEQERDVTGVIEECDRLKKELEYRDVMITTLQESNSELRVKCARAENKISELRLKCERKCKCCREPKEVGWKVSAVEAAYTSPVFPFLSEAESTRPTTPRPSLFPEVTSSSDPPQSPPHDQILFKVMKWQQCQQQEKPAETEGMSPGFKMWSAGRVSRSLSSTPVRPAMDNLSRLGVSARPVFSTPTSQVTVKPPEQTFLMQHYSPSHYSPNKTMYDCLEKADMYAQELKRGLSRLPTQLESIRTIGKHHSPVNSH